VSTLPTDREGEYLTRFLEGVSDGDCETVVVRSSQQVTAERRERCLPSLSPRLSPFLPFLKPGPGPGNDGTAGLLAPALGSPRELFGQFAVGRVLLRLAFEMI
jgi:hypothetical protein